MKRMTLIEYMVIVAIFAILCCWAAAPGYTASQRELKTKEQIIAEQEALVHAGATYALIRVDMTPDGGVKITPQYNPPYDESKSDNPLSHEMIKQMMKEQILGASP